MPRRQAGSPVAEPPGHGRCRRTGPQRAAARAGAARRAGRLRLTLPLAVHLAHDGWQIAGHAQGQPAPTIAVERDAAAAPPTRVALRSLRPVPDAGVVLA